MTEQKELKWISGFWRRIGALAIDAILIGVLGLILGLLLGSFFVQLGGWGPLIGLSISFIYFGVMNSSIEGGQTIGKRAVNIKVVDENGECIGLGRSLARYSILGLPFALGDFYISNDVLELLLTYPIYLISSGGALSLIYLYVFNRVTRQSLHDVIVGTYVVNTKAVQQQQSGRLWRPHLIVVGMLFLLAVVVPVFTTQIFELDGLSEVQTEISNNPDVAYAEVTSGTSKTKVISEGTTTTAYIRVKAILVEDKIADIDLARRLASVVVTQYPEILQKDKIQVVLMYGYNIGINSRWSKQTYNFNTDDYPVVESNPLDN